MPQPAAAGEPLRRMADTITATATATSCDRETGRYDYVLMREWVLDSGSLAGTTSASTTLVQSEHWLAVDGSGRATNITARTPAADSPPTDDTYPPGRRPVEAAPLPADPGMLVARLNRSQRFRRRSAITAVRAGGPQPMAQPWA